MKPFYYGLIAITLRRHKKYIYYCDFKTMTAFNHTRQALVKYIKDAAIHGITDGTQTPAENTIKFDPYFTGVKTDNLDHYLTILSK